MVSPLPLITQSLTGRARFRRGWFGRLVLEVHVEFISWEPFAPKMRKLRQIGPEKFEEVPPWYAWRDATESDIALGMEFRVPTRSAVQQAWREAPKEGA